MKKAIKVLSILLIIIMALSLVACNNKDDKDKNNDNDKKEELVINEKLIGIWRKEEGNIDVTFWEYTKDGKFIYTIASYEEYTENGDYTATDDQLILLMYGDTIPFTFKIEDNILTFLNEYGEDYTFTKITEEEMNKEREEIKLIYSTTPEDVDLIQFAEPQADEEIAIMKTDMGEIKIRFFPEQAPKAVENFKELAKMGFYDGVIFHRVFDEFMIQAGNRQYSNLEGEMNEMQSFFGEQFEDEFADSLRNFRGALSMANPGYPNMNGTEFFIVQNTTVDATSLEYSTKKNRLPNNVIEKYNEIGGTPHLDNAHTVFGFVFDGMDVVDKIAKVKANGDGKPDEDVKIISITIEKYNG